MAFSKAPDYNPYAGIFGTAGNVTVFFVTRIWHSGRSLFKRALIQCHLGFSLVPILFCFFSRLHFIATTKDGAIVMLGALR